MDGLLELGGAWLARIYAVYGILLLLLTLSFANLVLLGAIAWALHVHACGYRPWPTVPGFLRRLVRLALEVSFGLLNPLVYLAVLTPSIPKLRESAGAWQGRLTTAAWILLAAFWGLRALGAAIDTRARAVRAGIRTLLVATLACLLVFTVKDALLLPAMVPHGVWSLTLALYGLRLAPLYLIPAVLLWDYIRSLQVAPGEATDFHGLFLLPGRPARLAVATVVALALLTAAAAAHRRSDASVRLLVGDHREAIRTAADRYGVDARLVASIVYVTHRDQLSPFRDALERLVISAWAGNMRRTLGVGPPDQVARVGTDENPLLNGALDVSVGLAQIKPRTAQTASVLATGLTPRELTRPARDWYQDVEPLGDAWNLPSAARVSVVSPIPVPARRFVVAEALLAPRTNIEMCALILAQYQHQWEATNPAWSLRQRPDILATLYQLGFARSKPHAAPRSNAFGTRVRQVYEQPWLIELLDDRGRRPM